MVSFGISAQSYMTLKIRPSVSVMHLKLYLSDCLHAAGIAKPKETPQQTLQDSTKLNFPAELNQKSSVGSYKAKNRKTCLTCRAQLSLQYREHQQEKRGKELVNRAKQMKVTETKTKKETVKVFFMTSRAFT